MHRTYRYRLYPSKVQSRIMAATLDICRNLYNSFLHWRTHDFDCFGSFVTRYQQQSALPHWKKIHPHLRLVHSQVLQDVVHRVDLAFQAFFQRIPAGEKHGYPKRKGKNYASFTYTQTGFHLKNDNTLFLSKIGAVKVRLHRPYQGIVKTCTLRRVSGKWYACLLCECEPEPLLPSTEAIGLDVGLNHFAALSSGEFIANPRFFRRDEKALSQIHRHLRCVPAAKRSKVRIAEQHIHERIRNRRHDFLHQTAWCLVKSHGLIAVEKLTVRNMVRNHCLAKSISDAAWAMFRVVLVRKSESAGRMVAEVNPDGTSRRCSRCGQESPKSLAERWHHCTSCGLALDRDTNAARNILALALSQIVTHM